MFYNIKQQSIYFCFCGTDQQENILQQTRKHISTNWSKDITHIKYKTFSRCTLGSPVLVLSVCGYCFAHLSSAIFSINLGRTAQSQSVSMEIMSGQPVSSQT